MLEQADLTLMLAKKAYKQILPLQMERLLDLERLIYEQKRPVMIVFEGWDAAGKGTTIRALTEPLDPRGFKVLPTNAPRTHEQQKPWLWRFWMQIPRHGQIAIFDRSWYGRVLVERAEGLTPIPEWIRAYEEINAFERTLADDQTIFIKFWLHISKAEQLRRFLYLSQQPDLAWHVAAEDWEHHRKYDEYLAAVRDMLTNTNTSVAPWTVIPATDPNYRTYQVFRTLIERLEAGLGVEPMTWPDLAEFGQAAVVEKVKKTTKAKKEKAEKTEKAAKKDKKAQAAEKKARKKTSTKKEKAPAAPETAVVESGADHA
ncbi:MAG: polyphosphate kinase 2 family protein [Caldilineaceae bacterium]